MALPGLRSTLAAALVVIACGPALALAQTPPPPPTAGATATTSGSPDPAAPPSVSAAATAAAVEAGAQKAPAQPAPDGAGAPPQTSARRDLGTLRVTVVDETGAAIVDAPVRIGNDAGLDRIVQTSQRGEAIFDNLTPGKYALHVESVGFENFDLPDQNVRRGQTNRDVILRIATYVEQLDVTRDETEKALNESFSTALTQEQIDALPDDADEMAEMLEQMAGPGARLRVNGFTGGRLPPKSQIAEIRFRFDPFSAENHDAGFPRVDIRTRPGQGNWRNSMLMTFRDDALNARNAMSPVQGDQASQRGNWSVDGPILKGKTSFSFSLGGLNSYDTETINSQRQSGPYNALVQQPNDRLNFEAGVEHALSKAHMLRVELQRTRGEQQNLGIGELVEEERAYSQERSENTFRISESGTFRGRFKNEIRFEGAWEDLQLSSRSNALAVDVLGRFSEGGAQRFGGTRTREFEIGDDLEFAVGKKHALRTGFEISASTLRGDESQNETGTFTFSSIEDYEAGLPRTFRKRIIEDRVVDYSNTEVGLYVNDDIRVRKNVMLSLGLRYEAQSLMDDRSNFAPRAHVTWAPFKSGATTFRAGAGVFYDWFETSLYEDTLRVDGERQSDIIIENPCYPDPDLCGTPVEDNPGAVIRSAPILVMPEVQRYSAGFEQRITSWMSLRGNYYFQRGSNQFRSLNVNAPVNGVRPDESLGNISQLSTVGRSRNQGFDLSANFNYMPRRIFSFVHYRYGRNLNDGSATSLPADSNNLAAEWGPGMNDVRHRVNFSVNAPLAFGFRANTFLRYESAPPYTITTGEDANGDGVFSNDRPDGLGRNSARGADFWNVDLRLSWSRGFGPPRTPSGPGGPIRGGGPGGGGPGGSGGGRGGGGGGGPVMMMAGGGPGEQKRFNVELFLSANNVLNSVNYSGFNSVLTSPFFGQPTRSQAARRVEVGTRFGF